MITPALNTLIGGGHLSEADAEGLMNALMDGRLSPAQTGALLAALRMKGESVSEITGFARVMRERSVRVHTSRRPLVDTCGTGGDGCKTFNISTCAAFVVAGAGVAVAKHGNRSVTSKCGSADVLEALGVRIDLSPEQVGQSIDTVGIGFLFARAHHPAMKHAAPVRQELGIRTVFNALGPLTNPAGAARQVVGVYDAALCPVLAQVLLNLGAEHVLVVHGMDAGGLDEIATFGTTRVSEGKIGEGVRTYDVTPADLDLPECKPSDLAPGADADENAQLLRGVLQGETCPRRDIVLANAGAALYVAGIAETLKDGVQQAAQSIDGGAALAALDNLRRFTQAADTTEKDAHA